MAGNSVRQRDMIIDLSLHFLDNKNIVCSLKVSFSKQINLPYILNLSLISCSFKKVVKILTIKSTHSQDNDENIVYFNTYELFLKYSESFFSLVQGLQEYGQFFELLGLVLNMKRIDMWPSAVFK